MVTPQETLDITYRLLNAVGTMSNNYELLKDTIALTERINAVVKVEVEAEVTTLNVKLAGIGAEARSVKAELLVYQRDAVLWNTIENRLSKELSLLTLAHMAIQGDKPQWHDFPMQAEIDAWQLKEAEADKAVADKRRELSEHQFNNSLWAADVQSKQEEFNKLATEYNELRKRINALLGKPEDTNAPSSNGFGLGTTRTY
jgi:chromosome segregation ATPase